MHFRCQDVTVAFSTYLNPVVPICRGQHAESPVGIKHLTGESAGSDEEVTVLKCVKSVSRD